MALCLCMALAAPAWAADEFGKIMPSEIIYALDEVSTLSDSEIIANNDIVSQITKPASLDIDNMINIDIRKVHQTYPLLDEQIALLKEHNYTDDEIKQFDMGDFFNIESTWLLTPSQVEDVKYLYPELETVDISNWTIGDLVEYCNEADSKKYAPSVIEAAALSERNITLDDAQTLLKEYGSYENILSQSDEQLEEDIKSYYQFNISNIYNMCTYESNDCPPAQNPDSSIYIGIQFPGHQFDWFHKDSGTTSITVAASQAMSVQAAYECLYNTTASFRVQNLHGTYSCNRGYTHEGIDFGKPAGYSENCTIYSIQSGNLFKTGDGIGKFSVYSSTLNITASYLHMSAFAVSSGKQVTTGMRAGNQGNVGNSKGAHVHFQIDSGKEYSIASGGDNKLESLSPYFYINWFLSNR